MQGWDAAVATEEQCHPIPLSAWTLAVHQGLGVCFAQKTAGGRGGLGHPAAVVPGEVSWEGSFPKREASRGGCWGGGKGKFSVAGVALER